MIAAESVQTNLDAQTFGLIAGWGRYPIVVAEKLKAAGHRVVCCGIKGHADASLSKICDQFDWFGLARLGGQLRYFRRHGVEHATMAGKIFKTLLLERFHLIRHLPDIKCLRHFYPIYFKKNKDRSDDTMLLTVTELFQSGGVRFAPATDLVEGLLVRGGVLTKIQPSRQQLRDVEFGWRLAKEMGRLDVGQSVCVKDRAVVAVEAVEGTDQCIRRAGELCKAGGIVVTKVAKPQQDMRFDVPTVGISTLKTMSESGANLLAIEAEKTILLDRTEFLSAANELGLSVISLADDEITKS